MNYLWWESAVQQRTPTPSLLALAEAAHPLPQRPRGQPSERNGFTLEPPRRPGSERARGAPYLEEVRGAPPENAEPLGEETEVLPAELGELVGQHRAVEELGGHFGEQVLVNGFGVHSGRLTWGWEAGRGNWAVGRRVLQRTAGARTRGGGGQHPLLTVIQEELGDGQQDPGVGEIAADPAVQALEAGEGAVDVGGVLPADDVHDRDGFHQALRGGEKREPFPTLWLLPGGKPTRHGRCAVDPL